MGDPDGLAIYVNPAFEDVFKVSLGAIAGTPLASLFQGGGRESVLQAVVAACANNEKSHFPLYIEEAGFVVSAAPITAEDVSVGVILVLVPQTTERARVSLSHRRLKEPLLQLIDCLTELEGPTESQHDGQYALMIKEAMSHLATLRSELVTLDRKFSSSE